MLEKIKSQNSNIEYVSILDWKINIVSKEEALNNKEKNYYYLGWVRKDLIYNWNNRAKEIDIIEKSYCVVDLDIRKNFEEKYNEEISDEDIIKEWLNIAENLKYEDYILADFDFIVFTWNWLHIYWFWDYQSISPDDYSFWVKRLYERWNNFWWDKLYEADPACKNISRILRLPWSINQKTWKECKIIFERQWEWKIFNWLKKMWIKQKQEENKLKEEQIKKRVEEYQKKEQMNSLIYGKQFKDKKEELEALFTKIDSIPAYVIAEMLVPFKLNKNWKNFDNEKWWFTWYFYVEDLNCICNWWSRYFNNWDVNSCYSPSVLIKNFYDYTWAETIHWFKTNFKDLFIN